MLVICKTNIVYTTAMYFKKLLTHYMNLFLVLQGGYLSIFKCTKATSPSI